MDTDSVSYFKCFAYCQQSPDKNFCWYDGSYFQTREADEWEIDHSQRRLLTIRGCTPEQIERARLIDWQWQHGAEPSTDEIDFLRSLPKLPRGEWPTDYWQALGIPADDCERYIQIAMDGPVDDAEWYFIGEFEKRLHKLESAIVDGPNHGSPEAEREYRDSFAKYVQALDFDSLFEIDDDQFWKERRESVTTLSKATWRAKCHAAAFAETIWFWQRTDKPDVYLTLARTDDEIKSLLAKWAMAVWKWQGETLPEDNRFELCPPPNPISYSNGYITVKDDDSSEHREQQQKPDSDPKSSPVKSISSELKQRNAIADFARNLGRDAYRPHSSVKTISDRVRKFSRGIESFVCDDNTAFNYPIVSSLEFDDGCYKLDYFIDDFLVVGQPCIVGAEQKCFKTTTAVALAFSVASGRPFLGKFKVNRVAPVVVMSAESGMATLQATARSICNAAGVPLRGLANLYWCDNVPKIGDDNHMEALERTLQKTKAEILIVDPVYLAMPAVDPGNLFAQGALLASINEVCQRCGVTLILVHHLKKTREGANQPPGLADLSWSGFAEWARQWILLGRREIYEPPSVHRLWLVAGGSAGHSGLWGFDIDQGEFTTGEPRKWSVSLSPGHETRGQARQEAKRNRAAKSTEKLDADIQSVWDTLMAIFPNGETQTAVASGAGISGSRAQAALNAMIEKKLVIKCEVAKGGRKTPRNGYKLITKNNPLDPFADFE